MPRLALPRSLVVTMVGGTVATVAALASCDGGSNVDAACHVYCFDPGGRDAQPPGVPDAAPCGQNVCDPADCPPGCEPLA